jgi:hypothetical protein
MVHITFASKINLKKIFKHHAKVLTIQIDYDMMIMWKTSPPKQFKGEMKRYGKLQIDTKPND